MCHLILSQIEQETQDKLKIKKSRGKICGTCKSFQEDGAFSIHGVCTIKNTDVSRYQLCNLGVDDLDYIELSKIATGLLAVSVSIYGYVKTKYGRQIKDAETTITTLDNDKKAALEVITEVKTLFENGMAAKADGKITPEEMEKIFNEAMEIVNSPAVKQLLKNFGE